METCIIKKLIRQGLTPTELQNLFSKYSNGEYLPVITYEQIMNSNNIDDLFNNLNFFVIYYPLSVNNSWGHYCALIRHHDTIYFCDSYGYTIDDIKKFANTNIYDNEQENTLIRLLLESNYNVDFSHHKLQSKKKHIATCGRWAVLRCLKERLTNDEFYNYIMKLKKKTGIKDNDKLVATLIN